VKNFFNKDKFCVYILVLTSGFLFIFFYQMLVKESIPRRKFDIDFSKPGSRQVVLLSGWQGRDNNDKAIWAGDKSASICVELFEKTSYDFKIDILTPSSRIEGKRRRKIDIYFNSIKVASFTPGRLNAWETFSFIVPSRLIREKLNKIGFVNSHKRLDYFGVKNLSASNFSRLWYSLPRGYIFFESPAWFYKNGAKEKLYFCLLSGFLFFILFIFYSLWISSVTDLDIVRVFKIGLLLFTPSLAILTVLFLLSRIFHYTPIFYRADYFIITIGFFLLAQAVLLFKFKNRKKIERQLQIVKTVKNIITAHYSRTLFAISMLMILLGPFFYVLKRNGLFEKMSIVAYILISIIILFKFIEKVREK